MSKHPIDPLQLAGAKSKGKRPFFFDDPDTERVLNIVMAVAQEVSVLRERLDTIERLLERKGTLTKADIDAYEPTKAEADSRGLMIQEYLARILRVVQQDKEALEMDEKASEDVAEELAKS